MDVAAARRLLEAREPFLDLLGGLMSIARVVAFAVAVSACTAATGGEDELVAVDEDSFGELEGQAVSNVAPGETLRTTANVNLRSGPSTSHGVLRVIPSGATVTAIDGKPSGSFLNVRFGSLSGWIHGGYLDTVSTSPGPAPAGCRGQLTALGLSWESGGTNKGIADSVRVRSPIRGVSFRYLGSSTSSSLLANCAFFVKLASSVDKMKSMGVSEFVHIGTYNYRTIAGSTKLSQHALGMAIDIAGFRTTAGVYYSIANNAHFVKNTSAGTCTQARTSEGDKLFKGWACAAKAAGDFHVVLTPNYNAAHRDHLHLDLTPGGNTIKSWGSESSGAFYEDVDPVSEEPLGDDGGLDRQLLSELLDRELRIQLDTGATIAELR